MYFCTKGVTIIYNPYKCRPNEQNIRDYRIIPEQLIQLNTASFIAILDNFKL